MLPGCTVSSLDMQGHDPIDYYAKHPIKSTIELRNRPVRVHFEPGSNRLSAAEIDRLAEELRGVSMQAVESIQVGFAKTDGKNPQRKEHLTRMLRNMGYSKGNYMFEPLPNLKKNEVQLDVTYAAVVLPDCPDWRRSPVSTYSNTSQGNFRCAYETNLGLMVADPHDLVRGSSGGDIPIDTKRASKVLEDYRGGQATSAATTSASSSSGGGSDDSGASESGSDGAQ